MRTILQLAGVQDRSEHARIHRYNFVRLFGTAGQILGGKCELFLLPNKFVAALFHYMHNHPVSMPFGFISSDTAAHIETARNIFEELTTRKYKAYALNQEPEEEIDLKKEFATLAGG